MVVQALTLGLVNNLNAAEAIVHRWGYETLKRYRFEAIRRGLAAELGDRLAIPLLEDVLSAADEGLRSRGLNEEVFLQPLFRRLANKRLPANTAIHIWLRGGARKFVNYFKY
jgi:gamma-glutamylcysteine synthetase